MATAQCPIGDCDYAGPVKSVEAHISGSPAGEHAGRIGREFREQLVGAVEQAANGAEEVVEEVAGEGEGSILPALTTQQWLLVVGVALVLVWAATRRSREAGASAASVEDEEEDQPEAATFQGVA